MAPPPPPPLPEAGETAAGPEGPRLAERVDDGGGDEDEGAAESGYAERGNSTLGALFRRPGVVYPIHPTGHLRLPRPKRPFAGPAEKMEEGGGEEEEEGDQKKREEVIFVVQVLVHRGGWLARGIYAVRDGPTSSPPPPLWKYFISPS